LERGHDHACRRARRVRNRIDGGRAREPPVAERDVPDVAKAAVLRRLDADVMPGFRGLVVNPSAQMPGYVVCGEVGAAKAGAFERFFVVATHVCGFQPARAAEGLIRLSKADTANRAILLAAVERALLIGDGKG